MGLFNKKELKRIAELEKQINILQTELNENQKFMMDNHITDCQSAENYLKDIKVNIYQLESRKSDLEESDNKLNKVIQEKNDILNDLNESVAKQEKTLNNQRFKVQHLKKYAKEIQKAIDDFHMYEDETTLSQVDIEKYNELLPTIEIKLNCLNIAELKKEFRENDKKIKDLLKKYENRYKTKANQTIYKLMVIGLSAELQNALYNLKYDKESKSIDYIKEICNKYRSIASSGNQSIASTVNKFIIELEEYFIDAIRIEYQYYILKEKQKAEQAAIREQMRQEAEERKILEQQKKQVEKEEVKYQNEMNNVKSLLENTTDQDMIAKYQNKIKDLEELLKQVENKKEEIINRQNGKAGNVYVISNLGSFGENVFKVGMTRRLEPLDRIKELSSASVPFSFDVHAMIFSEDAVSLENKLHKILDNYRMNKINLRKEFFKIPLDDIEKIVYEEDPAAEFNRTMLAEEYRQSLSIDDDNSE
ncbi:GIY-YIG nuclease family protein [Faecalibacillus faecis]|uniref:GIY-YIG nuclease family protein n=1 Tax=Faecalibacillus faecis TaxID=1982628 RepID=UPI001E38A3C6|nr:GIY-YIG nuclease family protein [Faecalibacillus faecis]